MFLSPCYILMAMLIKTQTSFPEPTSFHGFFHQGTGQGWRTIHLCSSEGWHPNSAPRPATDSSHGLDSWRDPDFPICEPRPCCALRAAPGQLWGEPAPPQPPGCLGLLLFSTFLQGFWRQLFSSDFFVTTAGKEEAEIDNVQTRQNLHDVI